MSATLRVWTFKDGLLSRLAHDLRITVGRFTVERDGTRVLATFDPASARVDGVPKGDGVDAAALSEKDKRTIAETVSQVILPGIVTFSGDYDGRHVRGTLTMRGQARELDLPVRHDGDAFVVETELVPTRWGVEPYKALAGAIKLKDRWRVRLVLEGVEASRWGA